MPSVVANGIQIEHETFGEPSSSPLLLIIGLAGQLIFWDEELCKQLADRGHYVIRFDNRDVGFSSKLEELIIDLERKHDCGHEYNFVILACGCPRLFHQISDKDYA